MLKLCGKNLFKIYLNSASSAASVVRKFFMNNTIIKAENQSKRYHICAREQEKDCSFRYNPLKFNGEQGPLSVNSYWI